MSKPIAAVILAGGEARRMAGVKALRLWRGRPLIDHMLAIARGYSDCVGVAVKHAEQVGVVDATLLHDVPGIDGPLAGLAAALDFARDQGCEFVVTLACDTPLLPPDLADRLTAAIAAADLAAAPRSHGQLHPASALWRRPARDHLASYMGQGRASLRGFATMIGMTIVDWPDVRPDPFANANTPEELAALERL
jgi:molybdopterin-guanine dinucleotide biosynthesis protein A